MLKLIVQWAAFLPIAMLVLTLAGMASRHFCEWVFPPGVPPLRVILRSLIIIAPTFLPIMLFGSILLLVRCLEMAPRRTIAKVLWVIAATVVLGHQLVQDLSLEGERPIIETIVTIGQLLVAYLAAAQVREPAPATRGPWPNTPISNARLAMDEAVTAHRDTSHGNPGTTGRQA